MIVLVCGDRHYDDEHLIAMVLMGFNATASVQGDQLTVVQGGATGADAIARRWADSRHFVESVTVKAEWDRYGRRAGPIRNRKMYDEYQPDIVLAFHDDIEHSRGTKDMVNYARSQGGWVVEVKQDPMT